MSILTLFLIIVQLGKTSQYGLYGNQSLSQAVLACYDTAKPFKENFFSILHLICPQSLQCDGKHNRELNITYLEDHPNDTFVLSHGLSQEPNESLLKEARSNLKATFNALHNCCQKCYCTEDCRTRNNCCPLMERENKKDAQTSGQSCIQPYIYDATRASEIHVNYFLMTTDCLNTSVGEDVIRKCKYPNITFLDEIVPTYSKSSDCIYRNIYCAQCNNDFLVEYWRLNVKFTSLFSLFGKTSIPDSLESLCQAVLVRRRYMADLSIEVPKEIAKRKSDFICYQPISDSTCDENESSDKDLDYFMRYACSYYQSIFKGQYKNPFCYICSISRNNKDLRGCKEDAARFEMPQVGFTAVLRPPDYTRADNGKALVSKDAPCGCTEYFDQQSATCRQVSCPPTKTHFNCSCEPIISNITGLLVKIFLEVRPMTTSSHVTELFNATSPDVLVTSVERSVNSFFRNRWGPMWISLMFMYRETSLSDHTHLKFHVLLVIRSKLATDNILLMNNIHGLLYSGFKGTLLNTPIHISLGKIVNLDTNYQITGDYASDENNDLAFILLYTFTQKDTSMVNGRHLSYYQTLNKLMFCKRITLHAEEMSMLANLSLATGYKQYNVAFVFEESTQQICFDDFIKIYRPNSVAFRIRQSYLQMLGATFLFHILLMY